MAYLGNPAGTLEIVRKYHLNIQKKFGQNFLIDDEVLTQIVDAAEISPNDCVLEIGPGIGTMTQYLAEKAREVVAVEIDKALIPVGILPFIMLVFLTSFEVLVAFLQAYIFAMLAAVYIGGAAHPEH